MAQLQGSPSSTSVSIGRPDLLPYDRLPSPTADLAIELARSARSRGDRNAAVAWVENALRDGNWAKGRLWAERVSLMDSAEDYASIRALWHESPKECHSSRAVMRPVARAAVAAGAHEDSRALVRKMILLAATRRRIRPAVALRSKLRRLRQGKGSTEEAAGKKFQRDAAKALVDLNRVLDGTPARTFLLGGTLLGFIRDGEVIPWDKDIDVGVFASDVDPEELKRLLEADERFSVRRLDFISERLRVHHANGTMIDVFPHYSDGEGRVWHDGAATRWWNTAFDLEPVEFLGVRQYVPKNAEAYLQESYGDWRTPDPEFDARLDKPNVEIIDQGYFDTALYFSLLDAVLKGSAAKKERFKGLLRDLGEGEWLDRV